jgi:hypothetical protein
MNLTDIPFRKIVQIMKAAVETAEYRQHQLKKTNQCSYVTRIIEDVVTMHLSEEEQKRLKFAMPDLENKLLNEKIYRLMNRNLKITSRGSKPMNDLIEVCRLMQIGIENNVTSHFTNSDKRAQAKQKIDDELKLISTQVKRLKQNKHKQPIQSHTKGGHTIVNVIRIMEEMNDLYDLFNQAEAAVPEFVEDHIWDEDYEKLIVVRNRERFVLKGAERVVVFSILETPTTNNVHLIRFGSDYWQGAETSFDLYEEAFFIKPYTGIADAIAEIIDVINSESDLELSLMEDANTSLYDSYSSMNQKLSLLLA